MAKFGHMTIFGQNQLGSKHSQVSTERSKGAKKNSPMKVSTDVCFKSYGQNKNFGFSISPAYRLV